MGERLRIGEVAGLVGVTTKTVRHYEKIGLLQRPERSESGYRLYTADDLLEVHRIKRLGSLGLSLQRIKEVLGGSGSGRDLRCVGASANIRPRNPRRLSDYERISAFNL